MSDILKVLKNNVSEGNSHIIQKIISYNTFHIFNKKRYCLICLKDENITQEFFDEIYKKLSKGKLPNDYDIFLLGTFIFLNTCLFSPTPEKDPEKSQINNIKQKRHDELRQKFINSIYKIYKNLNDDGNFKDELLLILSSVSKDDEDKHKLFDKFTNRKINHISCEILFENKKEFLKKCEVKEYLEKGSVKEFIEDVTDIKLLKKYKSIYSELKLDGGFINNQIKKVNKCVLDRVSSTTRGKFTLPIIFEIDISKPLNDLIQHWNKNKSNININAPFLDYFGRYSSNKTSVVKESKSMSESVQMLILINIIYDKMDFDLENIKNKLSKSKISDDLKNQISPSLNSDNNLLLRIDSLSLKIEGIIREILKNNDIDTYYISDDKKEESTLTNLISLLEKELPNQLLKTKLSIIENVLNERSQFNIRNNTSHTFFKFDDYNENKFNLLLICLSLIIDVYDHF